MRLSLPLKYQVCILRSVWAAALLFICPLDHVASERRASLTGKNADGAGEGQVRPPRAYCAPIAQAVPSSSLCYDHLIQARDAAEKTTASRAQNENDVGDDADDERKENKAIGPPHGQRWKQQQLVYVRLETLGTTLQGLRTEPINELLARGVFEQLFEPPDESGRQRRPVSRNRAGSSSSELTSNIFLQISGGLSSLEPEERRLAQRCRKSMQRFLCTLAYPSCHFRHSDVSALVRPPCREDCLLLKEKLCPNLNWSKFSLALREAFNKTLKGTLNALDLTNQKPLLAPSDPLLLPPKGGRNHEKEAGPSQASTTSSFARLKREESHNFNNSIHFYWPHEHSIENCQSLPPFRPSIQLQSGAPGGQYFSLHHLASASSNHSSQSTSDPQKRSPLRSIKWPMCSSAGLTKLPAAQMSSKASQSHHNHSISDDCLYPLSDGSNYRGSRNYTKSGLTCQSWSSQKPHKHTSSELLFDNMKDARNCCRNPGGLELKPWCYTLDKNVPWEYCEIETCKI